MKKTILQNSGADDKKSLGKWGVGILVLVLMAGGVAGFVFFGNKDVKSGSSGGGTGLFAVRRGDLTISVTENGSIEALNAQDIKSEVEGRTTIITLVDEGTMITPEDVNNGKVLVELDSSEIQERLTQQEISFLNEKAAYTEAEEALDIQKKQNDSDIKAGVLKVRFSLMDLQKYLGQTETEKILAMEPDTESTEGKIAEMVESPELGGQALQRLRELDGDISLRKQEIELAKSKLEWTERLAAKNYVSKNDLEADKLDKERKDIAWQKAETAKDLFVRYEFPKEAQKLLSDYQEAERELERIEARARSKLAQAQAKLDSTKARYLLQVERVSKLRKQVEACVIKAPSPGQVVYSSSTDEWARRNRPIEIGAEVRERQKIISIPDTSQMKVKIKIHETWVDKIKIGQKTKIVIAAFPDKVFTGEVLKKSPLADPQDFFSLGSGSKVYSTDVSIEGTHEFIKTGMTAKVEVIIEQLKDVLSVPIQSVVTQDAAKVCYVDTGSGPQMREVETGLFNDDFVEIKSGLEGAENVLLSPPRAVKSEPGQS
ncbi:MAG TPA: efflux RND transporter periplasmic adaptor subunit [Sedimentisphaerales bacterium]|nr:efflux RND transporter periplasmic adaptor subunit [Sedimentisphaerales bacterium]